MLLKRQDLTIPNLALLRWANPAMGWGAPESASYGIIWHPLII